MMTTTLAWPRLIVWNELQIAPVDGITVDCMYASVNPPHFDPSQTMLWLEQIESQLSLLMLANTLTALSLSCCRAPGRCFPIWKSRLFPFSHVLRLV